MDAPPADPDMALVTELLRRWGDGEPTPWGDYFADDVVFERVGAGVADLEGRYEGITAMAAAVRGFLASFEDLREEVDRVERHGDRVIAFTRQRARGRASGAEVVNDITHAFSVDDGRIVHWAAYWRRDEAAAALGLGA